MKKLIPVISGILVLLTIILQLSSCSKGRSGETVEITLALDYRDIVLQVLPALDGIPSFETAISRADSVTSINPDADFIDEFITQYQQLYPSGLDESLGDIKACLHQRAEEVSFQASRILAKRIDESGLGEVVVAAVERPGIVKITVSGVESRNGIRSLCSHRGNLEFWEMYRPEEVQVHMQRMARLAGDSSLLSECLNNNYRPGFSILAAPATQMQEIDRTIARYRRECLPVDMVPAWSRNVEADGYQLFALKGIGGSPVLDGGHITDAKSKNDGYPTVALQLDEGGARQFARVTARLAADGHRPLAIVLDGKVLMTPVVTAAVEGGKVDITGDFTEEDVKYMAAIMKCGDIGATPSIISEY